MNKEPHEADRKKELEDRINALRDKSLLELLSNGDRWELRECEYEYANMLAEEEKRKREAKEEKSLSRKESIKISYPGSIISVNHYKYFGGRYTRKEVKWWMEELGWLIKPLHLEEWNLPLDITCSGYFKDARSAPDVHNLLKVIADAIQNVTGIDDKNYLMHASERNIMRGVKDPYLIISIKEREGK